jgi:hypothetical protein
VTAVAIAAEMKGAASPEWKMNATVIEACSCPMFCTCYFGSGHPASTHNMDMGSHAEEHFCRFNNAYRVNKGSYKGVKLDGAKFWISGDLGGDFTQGRMDWAVVTFDRATSQAQRDGLVAIIGNLFPVKWNSLTTGVGDISWTATKDEARATLDGGKTAEVALKKGGFGEGGQVPVIHGLQYWGADHNDGFVLMPNTVEAWRTGEKQYEFKGTNGFMMTMDIASKPGSPKGGS